MGRLEDISKPRQTKGVRTMNELYRKHYIKGHEVDVYGYNDEKQQIIYCVDLGKERRAKRNSIALGHGNPYPGTLIEYYVIILRNKKRIRLEIRA